MNFLAHIYLSGDNPMVRIGNFMADTIHGHKPEEFAPDIKKGILLHRAIDSFTDSHPVFRQGTKRLHPVYHHYAGIIVDIFYDHFLAKNWELYHPVPLTRFAQEFYALLHENENILTQRTLNLMPHMIKHNWLASYATIEGISRILMQMDHRTKYKSGMGQSVNELKEFYVEFEEEFGIFFNAVRAFSKEKLLEL
ncbi:ACP phosphodiesterase [Flavobacterium cyanobacteriorum]|uniref:ACP phosphodiesterase n=1 Tax=Flavobacterium cyanobacteriorum TaxID=2022802 RepID=A0A255ZGI5_9FLAO|nr:acyl carrier protein phosphodiesterase [Flavobacterium cyanobacteriorum]OYQ40549.1 ACP phosphodiesterase [Flavobacterium cyanobacteriorum]